MLHAKAKNTRRPIRVRVDPRYHIVRFNVSCVRLTNNYWTKEVSFREDGVAYRIGCLYGRRRAMREGTIVDIKHGHRPLLLNRCGTAHSRNEPLTSSPVINYTLSLRWSLH